MTDWFHPHMASTASSSTEVDITSAVSRETHLRAEHPLQNTHNLNELRLFCSLWPFPQRETLCEALLKRTDDFLDHTLSSLHNEEFGANPYLDLNTYQKAGKIISLIRRKQDPDWQRVRTPLDLSSLADADAITAEIDRHVRLVLRSVPFWELMRYALDITTLKRELHYYFCTLREHTKRYKMAKEPSPLKQC